MEKIRSKLYFKFCFLVDSNGAQGGLTLLWNEYSDLQIIHFNDRFITANVSIHSDHKQFMFTGLHGELHTEKRVLF